MKILIKRGAYRWDCTNYTTASVRIVPDGEMESKLLKSLGISGWKVGYDFLPDKEESFKEVVKNALSSYIVGGDSHGAIYTLYHTEYRHSYRWQWVLYQKIREQFKSFVESNIEKLLVANDLNEFAFFSIPTEEIATTVLEG